MADRGAGVRIDGAKQLRTTLRKAGEDLGDLKAAHAEAAKIAAIASADRAPVKSGKLARTLRSSGTKTAGIVRAGSASVPYANAVHWGRLFWPNRAKARARSVVTANPFISAGAQDSEGQWLPVYERAIDGAIQRVKGI